MPGHKLKHLIFDQILVVGGDVIKKLTYTCPANKRAIIKQSWVRWTMIVQVITRQCRINFITAAGETIPFLPDFNLTSGQTTNACFTGEPAPLTAPPASGNTIFNMRDWVMEAGDILEIIVSGTLGVGDKIEAVVSGAEYDEI